MTFKCLKGLAPSYLTNRFTSRSQTHNRDIRYKDESHVPLYRTAVGQRSFSFRASKLWNNLPDSVKDTSSIKIFKRTVKNILVEECWST